MRRPQFYLAVALALFASGAGAFAQDLDNGKRLSERWCAECHQISPGVGRQERAPPFAGIAVKNNITAATISSFLLLPHATMPNFRLSPQDAQDIAAFIMAMRK
jgi:mono/diheme cytochrome c family protein